MKYLLCDVDDTILNCADSLQQFIGEQYGLFSEERLKDHHNIAKLFGVEHSRAMEMVLDFHRSDYIGNMTPLDCAATVLPELYKAGYKFVAITACLNEIQTVERRRRNLNDVFGIEWEAIHCIGMVPSKRAQLEMYPASIWVDDLWHHAADGMEIGHKSFVMDRPYNRHEDHPEITRVTNWHEIMEKINESQ